MESQSSESGLRPVRPRRRVLVAVLVVLATLFGFLFVNALWLNRQVLNEDNWTDASGELLDSEPVREQTANFLVDEAYTGLDVQAQVASALPPRAQPLAGPISGGVRTLADRAMNRLLERPKVQDLWEDANRAAHKRLLNVLEGGSGNVSTEGGNVTLDLRTMLVDLSGDIGVGENAAQKLPPDAGQITVLKSDELELAQDGLDAFRGTTIVLAILTFGLFALAVFLAGGRREALRAVGFGFVVIGLLALIERKLAGDALVGALAESESVEPAVEDVFTIYTSQLVIAAQAAIAYGVVMILGAWLAGRTGSAVAARRRLSPYLSDPRWAYGGLAIVVLVLFAWGPTPATRNPLSMLVLAGLLALGVEVLRRQTAREYPEATIERAREQRAERRARRREVVAAGGQRLRERFDPTTRAQAKPAATDEDSRLQQLERLARLHDTGVLDDEEFAREKTLVLAPDGAGK